MYQRTIALPVAYAVTDGEELMEFPEIRELRFQCPTCEAPFAEIVAFKAIGVKGEAA